MPRALVIATAMTALALSACSDSKGAACTESSDCPSGNVCLTNRCERLCDTDSTGCPSGFLCDLEAIDGENAGICIDDSRVAPEIGSVAGNGSAACVGATESNCVDNGFIVEGTFTDSTVFELIGPAEAASQVTYALDLQSLSATGEAAELTVNLSGKPDVAAGLYVLSARNQAGADESTVQLLQGAPGPDLTGSQLIDRINGATTGVIDAARLDLSGITPGDGGTGGSGGTLYLYDNSDTPATDTNVGDRMWVRLTAGDTSGAAKSVAVDHARFEALCGDGDGCDISLGGTRFVVNGPGGSAPLNALATGGACKMFYDSASGDWSIESGCVLWRRFIEPDPTDPSKFVDPGDTGDIEGFKPYSPSSGFGFDGDNDTRAVITYSFACYLAESPVIAGGGSPGDRFEDDSSEGFFLSMAGADWDSYPTASFPTADANRSCVLLIED